MAALPIAVTLGDPAGIGPEVTERALRTWLTDHADARFLLCGPGNLVTAMAARLGPSVTGVAGPDFAGAMGQASVASGQAALRALDAAIDLAQQDKIGALVTAPISKEALALAGSQDRGHTEILARHLGQGPVAMAFFTDRLRLVLATVHIPLRQIFAALSSERVVAVASLLHHSLITHFNIAAPRLALAGLNPHAGEAGLLGDEETTLLGPAVTKARAMGIHLSAPLPADTVFRRTLDGEFDAVVALYHDQGLIPIKLLAFGDAVNVTLGLRLPRTSPDHGTAYDRAGQGTARADGMLAALAMAVRLAAAPR